MVLDRMVTEKITTLEEAKRTPFCPSHEKLYPVVFIGVRNISDAL